MADVTKKATRESYGNALVELGAEKIDIELFLTEQAMPEHCRFVTDIAAIDLTAAGEHEIVLAQGNREETVKLSVKDTVAPVAVFQDLTLQAQAIAVCRPSVDNLNLKRFLTSLQDSASSSSQLPKR